MIFNGTDDYCFMFRFLSLKDIKHDLLQVAWRMEGGPEQHSRQILISILSALISIPKFIDERLLYKLSFLWPIFVHLKYAYGIP